MQKRREFIKKGGLVAGGLALGQHISVAHPNVYKANDRIRVAVAGLNGRGQALIQSAASVANVEVTHLCDVDSRAITKGQQNLEKLKLPKAREVEDYRSLCDNPDIDAIAIASPDHWHAPMAIMAAKAGKAVYLEKPCCHNPAEGELLVQVRDKYGAVIQMGNQQRSGTATREAISAIHDGIIGKAYLGKAWYSNKRGSIGVGKKADVPDWLNWELWQGPAPRVPYKDNIVHYNWHWFWNWGTGEINNNGTHEIDIARWALGVKYPTKVTSSGGRYHFRDDWEFYDTQVANFEFGDDKMIIWEGESCNPYNQHDRGRGTIIRGTEGSVIMDRNGYIVYDMDNKVVKKVDEREKSKTLDLTGGGGLDNIHMHNFTEAIRNGTKLHAEIQGGYVSNLLPHLGNIAQECGGSININPKNGRVLDNPKAMKMWSREYADGWAPTL